MNIEEVREYALSLKGTSEDMPFGPDTLVLRVMGKIFMLMNLEGEFRINLKCDPEKAIELRETYSFVIPGFHMNKKHWNTILAEESIPNQLLCELIDHSYEMVAKGLTQKQKKELDSL